MKEITLYTGGTFDLFHAGHVNFLKQCSNISHSVVVGINTDEFIERYKGKKPTYSLQERICILESCRYVSRVVINESCEDSKPTINTVRPDIIAIGTDWAARDYYKQMKFDQAWLDQKNITLAYIPYTQGISTTEVVSKVKAK